MLTTWRTSHPIHQINKDVNIVYEHHGIAWNQFIVGMVVVVILLRCIRWEILNWMLTEQTLSSFWGYAKLDCLSNTLLSLTHCCFSNNNFWLLKKLCVKVQHAAHAEAPKGERGHSQIQGHLKIHACRIQLRCQYIQFAHEFNHNLECIHVERQ